MREVAKIDGAGEWRIYWHIYLPMARAGVAALGILMFVQVWNDYMWQMLTLTRDHMKTIQVGVAVLNNASNPDYGLRMAGASMAAIPLILVFLFFQKYFTKGITIGAVKG